MNKCLKCEHRNTCKSNLKDRPEVEQKDTNTFVTLENEEIKVSSKKFVLALIDEENKKLYVSFKGNKSEITDLLTELSIKAVEEIL